MSIKQCVKCSKAKELEDFGKRKHRADGRDYYCRLCRRAASRKWAETHRDYTRQAARDYRLYGTSKATKVQEIKQAFTPDIGGGVLSDQELAQLMAKKPQIFVSEVEGGGG